MIKLENSVVINRPIDEVFEFMANSENNPQWQSGAQEVMKTSEGPIDVGTTYTSVSKILGRGIESTVEYTAYEPNGRLAGKTTSGPIPFQFETTFEPVAEGGTKVTSSGEGDVGGFFKLAEPLVARMLKRQTESDTANLKDLLEARGQSSV
jgi:uncharacterized protein YndB with AHSA1/START domain